MASVGGFGGALQESAAVGRCFARDDFGSLGGTGCIPDSSIPEAAAVVRPGLRDLGESLLVFVAASLGRPPSQCACFIVNPWV